MPQDRVPRFAASMLLLAWLAGCGLWRPTSVPMRTIREAAQCSTQPRTLLVMLPGSYSLPEDFLREGLVAAVHQRRIAADIVLVDAHLGYYSDKTIVDRLQADIIEPARANGYSRIWLVGISVGAFGALIYPAMHAEGLAGAPTTPGSSPLAAIEGIVALGPYLGKRSLSEEIAARGGLQAWHAPVGALDRDDIDTILWRWLQAATKTDPRPDGSRPAIFLGYGRDDRFAPSDQVLAAALPADHVFTARGGHDWKPWLALWQQILERLPLPVNSSCLGDVARPKD